MKPFSEGEPGFLGIIYEDYEGFIHPNGGEPRISSTLNSVSMTLRGLEP